MTQPTWTLERFRRSGRSHIDGAQHLLKEVQAIRSPDAGIRLGSAAYLAHVALECVLKARLLSRNACASAEDLQRKHPNVYAALFSGKLGHNLQFIADKLRLPELMRVEGKPWVDDDCWNRIASSKRPYSLRYGAEDVSSGAVEEELQRSEEIIAAVLAGTRTVPLTSARRARRR